MGRTLNEDDVLKEIDRWIGYLDEDMITRIKIGIKKLQSVQPEQCEDAVSRQAAIEALMSWEEYSVWDEDCLKHRGEPFWVSPSDVIKQLPPAQPEQRWIPFKTRPLTEEEKEEHPEWDCILDCKLPDDGQRILVSINLRGHEEVQQDEFYSDDGSYLDSGYEIGTEAVAWMPLPEPYREEGEK